MPVHNVVAFGYDRGIRVTQGVPPLMATVVRLHVTSEILAVAKQSTDHHFVTIPVGSVIETFDDLVEPGLRPVMFDGKDLLAFTRDIRERTQRKRTITVEEPQSLSPDRRQHARFPIHMEVAYRLTSVMLSGGIGRTINLSTRGVFFMAESVPPIGSSIELAIDWPARVDAAPLSFVAQGIV